MNGMVFSGANPHLKKWARAEYRRALRTGLLERQPCVRCGSSVKGLADGHHEDYAEPLKVIWLCRFHHRCRHNGMPLTKLVGAAA